MQTYTHLGVGMILGKLLFPDNWILQGFCAFGAIMPDIPATIEFILNKIKGAKPFTESSEKFFLITDITHSFTAWIFCIIAILIKSDIYLGSAWAGIISHLIIDTLTHNGKKFYRKTSKTLLLSSSELSKHIGIWDYRYGLGVLRPKPFEAIVDVIMIAVIYSMYLYKI